MILRANMTLEETIQLLRLAGAGAAAGEGVGAVVICPHCGTRLSCSAHEATLTEALARIKNLETDLAITAMERAERTRMWNVARLEVARLADKVAALEGRS